MSAPKRILILIISGLFAVSTVMGQTTDSQSEDEMSIEESYLQEAIELMVIRESTMSDSRDQKLVALEYIGKALERGSTNQEIFTALEYLSLEGTLNKARMGGRLVNNYPDVRRQAAKYLGTLGNREAKSALMKICNSENEPLVTQEAIKALAVNGLNDNNDAVYSIVEVTTRMHNTGIPDNLVALAAVEALDKLTAQNKDVDPAALQLLNTISDGGVYATPVRERAKQVLINMHRYAVRNRNQSNE